MQIIEFVKNGELDKVHKHLANGYTVKSVHLVTQTVALDGCMKYADGHTLKGDVFAYIVLEK